MVSLHLGQATIVIVSLIVSFVLYAVAMILTKANAIAEENEYTI